MGGAVDQEQLLVIGAGGLGEGVLAQVQAVGVAAGDHQQGLIDEFDPVGGVPAHQVEQAAGGVAEGRVGVRVAAPVVLVTLPVHLERQRGNLLVAHVGVAGVQDGSTGRLLRARSRRPPKALGNRVQLRVFKSVAAHPTGVEHAQRGHRLEALVGLGRVQGVAATAADAQQAQALRIHARVAADEVRRAVDVLGAELRRVGAARLARAAALVGGVHRHGDVAHLGQALGVQPGGLLLDPAIGVGDHDRSVLLVRIVVGRGVDIGRDRQAIEVVGNRVDVDLARHVLRDRPFVGQGERVEPVVGRRRAAGRQADHGGQRGNLNALSLHVEAPAGAEAGLQAGSRPRERPVQVTPARLIDKRH